MINEQLMEKVGKDLESIVAGDRKARETMDQVKQVAGMGRTIHYNVKIVICAAALVGLYCLWNVFFRYEDFTIYWIVAIYAYICFVTSLPRLFRMQFRIPDQYELNYMMKEGDKMISNQILQNTLDGLKGISRTDFCVTDMEGKVLATTFSESVCGEEEVMAFANSPADSQVVRNNLYFKIYDDHQMEYILVLDSQADDAYTLGKLVAFQIQGLLTAYKERFNKDNFIKNLLLDNLLLVDIQNRAKKLHIEMDARRVVYILETNQEKDYGSLENIKNLLGGKSGDFVTAVDEKSVIIVKELAPADDYAQLEKTAYTILSTLGVEKDGKTHIAYGTIVKDLKEVSRSYKEARMALDVGKIFFGEREVIAYSSLGIGRLIYQLPIPLCKMFIREIFDGKSPDDFDEETLTTINKFFENSLNVSETSRQLYIHRNTLVYRLDKLQKSTGLDLRVFEDAITFKIALMVVKYMKYMETLDY